EIVAVTARPEQYPPDDLPEIATRCFETIFSSTGRMLDYSSQLHHDGYVKARSVDQTAVFAAAEQFARTEGILPAPESAHAIRVAIDEAAKCKETGEEKTIVFGLTGTGYFDMTAYEQYNNGTMTDYTPTDEELQRGFDGLPKAGK
ncbi:MAG: pyridoxal-phosphate dependent enzyme, partial [Anaerovoracaceae bacterium]|nr:pyridoxal-phosphate dependent enzyme [Anaerovoracaceae bacterium]